MNCRRLVVVLTPARKPDCMSWSTLCFSWTCIILTMMMALHNFRVVSSRQIGRSRSIDTFWPGSLGIRTTHLFFQCYGTRLCCQRWLSNSNMTCLGFPDICFSMLALNLVIPGDLLFDLASINASFEVHVINVPAYCHVHVCIEAWDVLCEHECFSE
jgi:hypothetical protein